MASLIYNSFHKDVATGAIDLDTDTIKCMLTTSSYTPSAAHSKRSDITNEVTGTNYTTGGTSVTPIVGTTTAANSWATTWATGTAYVVGDVVRPTSGNGHLFKCIIAGTSHATTEPTWTTTAGQVNTDNTVTWAEAGISITVFTATAASWASSTITARYAVLYKSRGGASSSDELVCLEDFTSDKTSTNGTFTVTFSGVNNHSGFLDIF